METSEREHYHGRVTLKVLHILGQSIGIDENIQRSPGQTARQTDRRTWLDRLG